MALLLYRIGRASYRMAWRMLVIWLVAVGVLVGLGVGLGGQMQESFEIPGTESQEALDRLDSVFPQVAGASAQVVIEAPDGVEAHRQAIEDVVTELNDIEHVEQALSPWSEYATSALSDDGEAAIVRVQFDEDAIDALDDAPEQLQDTAKVLRDQGMKVEFGGTVYQDIEYGVSPSEGLGVVVAGVVLIVALGSVLAAGMPLLAALLAVGVTMGAVLIMTRFATVSSATPMLAVMIGLAVGIDYALFIISRHRQQLARGMDAQESAATAVGTAGSAVVFAGATVMVALMGLVIVGIPFLSVMGMVAAAGVLMALCASVTLVPALLGMAGERLRPKPGSRVARRESGEDRKPTMGRRWVRLVMRAPWVFAIAVIAILGAIALPALQMELSLPSARSQAEGTTARDAYDIVEEHFGAGSNGPLVVMLDITQVPNDKLQDSLVEIRDLVAQVPGVASTGDALPNPTVDSAILQVIPTTGPDEEATFEVVEAIRALEPQIEADYGAKAAVTGATAVQIDITHRLDGALLPFAFTVVGLSFLLLMMVFRSILVPLKAAVSFLLSAFAAFGVVVAVFQLGVLGNAMGIVPGPIIAFMPVLLLAIVFGLAMDYEVFLVSGMRESYVRGEDARQAVENGFAHGARVVTAAALIMFFVFFAFVPEGAGVIKAIALGLAAGIAFDAFLVRMTLVPALMTIFGRWAWWLPRWLSRLIPDLDIEGERLRGYLDQHEWARSHGGVIAAEDAVLGSPERSLAPVTVKVEEGSALIARGDAPARRILAATLSGRIDPVAGRLNVLGHSLPGDGGALRSLVTGSELSAGATSSLGALLREHGELARGRGARSQVRAQLAALNDALARGGSNARVDERTQLDALEPLARSLAHLALAAAEHPAMIVADLGSFSHHPHQRELVAAIMQAAPALFQGAAVRPTLVFAGEGDLEPLHFTAPVIDLRWQEHAGSAHPHQLEEELR